MNYERAYMKSAICITDDPYADDLAESVRQSLPHTASLNPQVEISSSNGDLANTNFMMIASHMAQCPSSPVESRTVEATIVSQRAIAVRL